jgi:HK97 family phage major capsid protein
MSDYIKRQHEERSRAYEAAKEIMDLAASENRELSADEEQSVQAAFADMDRRGSIITEMISQERRDAEIADAVRGFEDVARPDESVQVAEVNDVDIIRSLARGEMRSATFEQRDVTKGSTGAPVPTSFYDQVLYLARAVGPMLDVATVLNTAGGENLQIPSLSAYSTGTVTSEASTIGESDPTMNAFVTLSAYKYSFLTQVSTELIEDSGVDILSLISTNVGNALGYAVNTALTTGTGTVQPKGIVAAAGSGITGGTGVSGAFTYDNLVDLIYSTDAAARMLPGFGVMASGNAIAQMRKLQDGAGQYVFQPSLADGTPDRVLGYPLIENPAMASVATSAKSVIAGHFPSYIARTVGGIRLDRSDDYAFADGLVTFRATFRVDGNLPQTSHVKYFAGGAS